MHWPTYSCAASGLAVFGRLVVLVRGGDSWASCSANVSPLVILPVNYGAESIPAVVSHAQALLMILDSPLNKAGKIKVSWQCARVLRPYGGGASAWLLAFL